MSQMHTGLMVSLIFCLVRNIQLFLRAFIYSIHLKGGCPQLSLSLSLSPPPLDKLLAFFLRSGYLFQSKESNMLFPRCCGTQPSTHGVLHAFSPLSFRIHFPFHVPRPQNLTNFQNLGKHPISSRKRSKIFPNTNRYFFQYRDFFLFHINYTVICFISHSP